MDERYLEQAAALEQAQRDTAVNTALREARLQLQRNGQPYCEDCGEAIPPARRHAAPSAIRCKACQTNNEHDR